MAIARWFCGLIVFPALVLAQGGGATGGATGGGATGGSTGGGTGGGNTGGGNTGGGAIGGGTRQPTTLPQTTPTQPQMQQPIFISGQVMLDDGTPPPSQTVIERVCQNRVIREGYTDSKGFFSVQLGQNQGVFADASTDMGGFGGQDPFGRNAGMGQSSSSGSTEMQLASCELRANLAGYRSESLPMFNIRPLNRNDVGVIILHYFGNVQGLTVSATSALAPKEAKKSLERAMKASEKNDPDTTQKELLKAVGLYPRYAEAWFQLGKVYERRDHKEEALEAYKKAVTSDGSFVPPHERLYMLAYNQQQWAEVVTGTEKVIRLNPFDFPGAYYINAVANFQLKQYDAAEKSAREATKLKGKQAEPRSFYILGLTLAQKGVLPEASASLKTFLKAAPTGINVDQVRKILGDIENFLAQQAAPGQQPPQ